MSFSARERESARLQKESAGMLIRPGDLPSRVEGMRAKASRLDDAHYRPWSVGIERGEAQAFARFWREITKPTLQKPLPARGTSVSARPA